MSLATGEYIPLSQMIINVLVFRRFKNTHKLKMTMKPSKEFCDFEVMISVDKKVTMRSDYVNEAFSQVNYNIAILK